MSTLNVTTTTELAYWIPEVWATYCYQEAIAKMFWERFTGEEGSGMPVIRKTELLTQAGDIIHVSRLANLTVSTGVTGETSLAGSEQKLSLSEVQITPEWNRNAIAVTGKAKKQITQDFRMKAMVTLSNWLALKQDLSLWTAALLTTAQGFESAAPSVIYANDATSVDTLDSSDTFGVQEIRQAVAILEANNIGKVSVPGMPAGEGYYICFIHPYQAYDLKADSEWIDAHTSASIRGATNPLFTGALGEIDGAIIHSTTQCAITANSNSPSINTAKAVMVGQEALARGVNADVTWSEDVKDYGFETGIAIAAAWQDKILSSNAIVQIASAAVTPS